MSIDLGRLLVTAGVISPAEVEAALFLSVLRGISFPRALVDRGALTERTLEEELDRLGGLALRQVMGSRELFARLPRAVCRRLAAVPTRHDPATSTVDVAAADPLDPHVPAELGFHLGLPVRVLRAPITAVEEAIRGLELDEKEPAPARARPRRVTPAFPHGAPQSTIPPPPSDDVPIPLVRRAAASDGAAAPTKHTRTARPVDGPGARRRPRPAPERDADAAEAPEPTLAPRTVRDAGSSASVDPARTQRPAGAAARPPVLRAPSQEPPAVSFPSSLPPAALASDIADGHGAELCPPVDPSSPDRAALRAPPLPNLDSPRSDPVPATLRHGRFALGRPVIAINIPPPREPEFRAGAEPATGEAGPSVERKARAEAQPAQAAEAQPRQAAEGVEPRPARASEWPLFADLAEVFGVLDVVRTRDDIVSLALQGLRLLARRVAVFTVRRGAFHGHACNPEFGDEAALRALAIPAEQPSLLATATATTVYLGPVPGTPAHAPLLDVMLDPSSDVAAVAVRVAGRPVMVLVADDLGDTLHGTRSMDELARAVGDALTRILASRL